MTHEAVIFDMGGVVVELGPLTEMLGAEAGDSLPVETFWARWLASPTVRAFEMGQCSVQEFGDGLVEELGLGFSGEEMVERFRRWPRGLFEESERLIADLRPDLIVGVLSNTNALHWTSQQDHERVRALFDRAYLSYEMGVVKPDAVIFERVVADLAVPADRVLFLDDNQINVDGARAAGLEAHVTNGPQEARAVLASLGLLR